MNCNKCNRKFIRKCDLSRHTKLCGRIYLHFGYECYINKDGNEVFVHKEVLEEKLGRKLRKNEHSHHINGNKRDNRPENLEVNSISNHSKIHWKENPEKFSKTISNGKINKILKDGKGNKLTIEQVIEIRKKLLDGIEMKLISKEYKVSYDSIKDIKNKRTWKFV